MAGTSLFRLAQSPAVPWKNGGGTTREIAVFPPGAGLEDFLWRLSLADVAAPGPFSAFAGIDRVLALQEGAMELTGPGLSHHLDATSAPLALAGEVAVSATPLPHARVFNAMVRRGQFRATMARLAPGDTAPTGERVFLLATAPQSVDGQALEPGDCLEVTQPVTVTGPVLALALSPA